jgi:hypothetical protein
MTSAITPQRKLVEEEWPSDSPVPMSGAIFSSETPTMRAISSSQTIQQIHSPEPADMARLSRRPTSSTRTRSSEARRREEELQRLAREVAQLQESNVTLKNELALARSARSSVSSQRARKSGMNEESTGRAREVGRSEGLDRAGGRNVTVEDEITTPGKWMEMDEVQYQNSL